MNVPKKNGMSDPRKIPPQSRRERARKEEVNKMREDELLEKERVAIEGRLEEIHRMKDEGRMGASC
jgi:hypothetical protein